MSRKLKYAIWTSLNLLCVVISLSTLSALLFTANENETFLDIFSTTMLILSAVIATVLNALVGVWNYQDFLNAYIAERDNEEPE